MSKTQASASETPNASDLRYRALFNNKAFGIARGRLVATADGAGMDCLIDEVNEAYACIVGIRTADAAGHLFSDTLPARPGNDVDVAGILGRIGLTGVDDNFELSLPRNGQWLSVHAYSPLPGECVFIVSDITARKLSETTGRRHRDQLQAILDHSPVLISMKDTQGRVILANQALLDMVGAASPDEFVGRSVFDLFPPDVARQLWANDAQAFESNVPVRAEEVVCDKDGVWRTYLTIKFPVRDSGSGLNMGVCAISTDITEQKLMEQEIRQACQQLETRVEQRTHELHEARLAADAANRAKSDFLTTMSHEIRTPLNGLLGFTNLLLQGPLTEDKRRYAELAHESGEVLLHLLNDFLDVSKIEAGHLALEHAAFQPAQEVAATLALIQNAAHAKGLQLACDVQAPAWVMGDAARLKQILLNFMSNAVKFTAQGTVALRCTTLSQDEGKVWLQFEVIDTGIGIDAAQQASLFQPFMQAEASTTRRFGGTGLGLAICKRLAEAMQGQVGVRSALNQGSTFWLRLPFDETIQPAEPVASHALAKPDERPSSKAVTSRRAVRILVAEDNAIGQLLVDDLFKHLGYQIDIVGNGHDAIEQLARQHYDLVFMDCWMPIMDGLQATRLIRAHEQPGQHVPILALTASALTEDVIQCKEAGMDDFIAKPIRLDRLISLIAKWAPHA